MFHDEYRELQCVEYLVGSYRGSLERFRWFPVTTELPSLEGHRDILYGWQCLVDLFWNNDYLHSDHRRDKHGVRDGDC